MRARLATSICGFHSASTRRCALLQCQSLLPQVIAAAAVSAAATAAAAAATEPPHLLPRAHALLLLLPTPYRGHRYHATPAAHVFSGNSNATASLPSPPPHACVCAVCVCVRACVRVCVQAAENATASRKEPNLMDTGFTYMYAAPTSHNRLPLYWPRHLLPASPRGRAPATPAVL